MTEAPRDPEARFRKLRHDLSNPLSAMLAEAQLQLLNADQLPADAATAFRDIERLAQRMRDILKAAS